MTDQVKSLGFDHLRGAGWEDLRDLAKSAPQIGSIWVIDADGNLVASSERRDEPPASLADREYYKVLKSGQSTYINGLLYGRINRQWFFTYSQAIRVNGEFRGMVNPSMYVAYFQRFYDSLKVELGPEVRIAVYKRDGTVLVRWPLPEADATKLDVVDTPLFRDGRFLGVAGRDEIAPPQGDPMLQAYRTSPGHDLVAAVAVPRSAVLTPFWERLRFSALRLTVSLLLIAALVLAWNRSTVRERREISERRAAERMLAERTQQLEGMFEHAPLGLALQLPFSFQMSAARLGLVGAAP